jgi:predicted component of type VI protein secretion system
MRKVILGLGTAMLLVFTGCASGDKKVAGDAASTTTATFSEFGETFPDEGVTTTTKPEVARKKVGDTATLVSTDTNEEVSKAQVAKVAFSSGDEFNQPERGQLLGVYVKVKALADEQSSLAGDFYVLMRGHHYDPDACCVDAWKPDLDYVDLNEGETAEGWMTFDVPARHGQVVLSQSFGGGVIGTWSF